jgi:hypothetical protein
MNVAQLLGVSALAFAGAVSAQTIPPEQWVGAPIPAVGALSRAAVAADNAASAVAIAKSPQEFRVGPPDASPGAISRAEVLADLNLWIKSGLSQVANQEGFDPSSAAYRPQMATYRRMRGGPEFLAEVQRIKGASVATSAQLGAGSGSN